MTKLKTLSVPIFSIAFSLIFTSLILFMMGSNPFTVLSKIFMGSFGNSYGFSETVVKAIPIMLCALGVAIPAWVGLLNIGAEGQLYMGAIGAGWIALSFPEMGSVPMIFFMFLSAFIFGGVWCGIAGILRTYKGVNEIMVTLLMNFIAILLLEHLVHGIWKDPASHNWPYSKVFSDSAILPFWGDTRVHLGLVFAIIIAFLFFIIRKWTPWGFAMKVIGANAETAFYSRIKVNQYFIYTMIIGGGIAAIAGMAEVSAIQGRLRPGISPGYGYTGFLVSWLSNHNPLAIIACSIFIGGIVAGGDNLQIDMNLPFASINIILGAIFFFLMIGNYLTKK